MKILDGKRSEQQKKKQRQERKKGRKSKKEKKKQKANDPSSKPAASTMPCPADRGIDPLEWDAVVSGDTEWRKFCTQAPNRSQGTSTGDLQDFKDRTQNLAVAMKDALEGAEKRGESPANATRIKSRLKILESPTALCTDANAVEEISCLVRAGILQIAEANQVGHIWTSFLSKTGSMTPEEREMIKGLHAAAAPEDADVSTRLPEESQRGIFHTGTYAPFRGTPHVWMDSKLAHKFWATFQGLRRCWGSYEHDGGCDAWLRGLDPEHIPDAYDHLDENEALHQIKTACVDTLKTGLIGVPWGKKALELYDRVAKEIGFIRLDCTPVAVDAVEKFLGRSLCKMERLILEESFIGAYYFVNPNSKESFLLTPIRHPECLSDYGRSKLSMWHVVANFAPIIVAKVLGMGQNPSQDQLESTAKELSKMCADAPECPRSENVKVWTLLDALARRPHTEWSQSTLGMYRI